MKNPKEKTNKKWIMGMLGFVLLILLCCILPKKALHWSICKNQGVESLKDVVFQEFCPIEVEQLYEELYWEECAKQDKQLPSHTEVLISACKNSAVRGVPGGEYLFVHELKTGEIYLLDLRTGEKKQVSNDPLLLERGIFLSSDLVWLEGSGGKPDNTSGYRPHYILDLTDGKRYEIYELDWLPRLEDGYFDPKNYAYFESANQSFIHYSKNYLIALSSDFNASPDKRVILSQYALESGADSKHGAALEQLMNDLGIEYEVVDFSLRYADVLSPTGKYVVRNDGIYLSGTDIPVITREDTGFIMSGGFEGWYYDESGVVFARSSYHYYTNSFWSSRYPLPRSVLKLNLPVP